MYGVNNLFIKEELSTQTISKTNIIKMHGLSHPRQVISTYWQATSTHWQATSTHWQVTPTHWHATFTHWHATSTHWHATSTHRHATSTHRYIPTLYWLPIMHKLSFYISLEEMFHNKNSALLTSALTIIKHTSFLWL